MSTDARFKGGSGSGYASATSKTTSLSSNKAFGNVGFGTLLTAGGSLYSGISKFNSANQMASSIMEQGSLALGESLRAASIIREEGRNFMATQSLQYIGAGVHLAGSALITIAQTKKYSETEAKAEENRGKAKYNLASQEAKAKKAEGRAGLIGGIFNTAVSLFTAGV